MLYEIHDDKAELACCLHPHTPQGIYNIFDIKGLAMERKKEKMRME